MTNPLDVSYSPPPPEEKHIMITIHDHGDGIAQTYDEQNTGNITYPEMVAALGVVLTQKLVQHHRRQDTPKVAGAPQGSRVIRVGG